MVLIGGVKELFEVVRMAVPALAGKAEHHAAVAGHLPGLPETTLPGT